MTTAATFVIITSLRRQPHNSIVIRCSVCSAVIANEKIGCYIRKPFHPDAVGNHEIYFSISEIHVGNRVLLTVVTVPFPRGRAMPLIIVIAVHAERPAGQEAEKAVAAIRCGRVRVIIFHAIRWGTDVSIGARQSPIYLGISDQLIDNFDPSRGRPDGIFSDPVALETCHRVAQQYRYPQSTLRWRSRSM